MSSELTKGAEVAVKVCLNVKKDEKVIIITDSGMDPDIPLAILDVAKKITDDVELISMEPLSRNGEEPPIDIASIMRKPKVLFLVTSKSLTHTNARRDASEAGVRVASMPGVKSFSFTKGGMTADYNKVKELGEKMKDAVDGKRKFRLTSENGTDLEMKFGNHPWYVDHGLYHNPGDVGNLPAGEVDGAPNEGSSRGILVIDKMGGFGEKIKMTVENGHVTKIEGSEKLEAALDEVGEKAKNIAEFGIGTNPEAKITGNVLEDEKVYETVHVALGNNVTWGGSCDVPLHLDGVILKPTLEVDGKVIIREGKWLI